MKKKIVSILIALGMFFTTSQAFAVSKETWIKCPYTYSCKGESQIKSWSSFIEFFASSQLWAQNDAWGEQIVALRTTVAGYEGSYIVAYDDSEKETDASAAAGDTYNSPVRGRQYKSVSTHFFYKRDGSAWVGGITLYQTY